MFRKLIVSLTLLGLTSSVNAATLTDAIAREAERAAQQSEESQGIPPNYLWTGIGLLGGGGAFLIAGAMSESKGETCVGNTCVDNSSIKKARLITGGALAGAGAFFLARGISKSHEAPSVQFVPGGVAIRQPVPLTLKPFRRAAR